MGRSLWQLYCSNDRPEIQPSPILAGKDSSALVTRAWLLQLVQAGPFASRPVGTAMVSSTHADRGGHLSCTEASASGHLAHAGSRLVPVEAAGSREHVLIHRAGTELSHVQGAAAGTENLNWRAADVTWQRMLAVSGRYSSIPIHSNHGAMHPAGRLISRLPHLLDCKDASQAAARPRAEWYPVTILPALLA